MNLRSARKIFARSPATFRPMARWIWNDHVDADRLAEQLDAMLAAGFGGALIRPGAGLPPGAYLGETWFEAVAAVAKRARKQRASIWIAEDFNDPATQSIVSGILRDAPDRAAQVLVMDDVPAGTVPAAHAAAEFVAAFEVTRESARPAPDGGRRAPQSLRALTGTDLSEAAPVRRLLFRLKTSPDRLSLFDADATQQLIERTHQRYHLQARKYFGNTIGLCLMLGASPSSIPGTVPWDAEAPALFQESHGYSLISSLPALFFDLPGHEAVRFDFWGLLDDMLLEGFTQPFVRWSTERGIPHACALPAAPSFPDATPRLGRTMARYAEHSFAAIVSDTNDVALHEARSIKRQLGQEGMLEVASRDRCAGRIGCAMERAVHGVTFIAERAVPASLRGDRKHDGATVIGSQDEDTHLRAQFDAEARLAWMLGQGRAPADVLLLHPYTSLQAAYCVDNTTESSRVHAAIARHFEAITRTLATADITFDYGDEAVLARHGHAGHRAIRVGQAEYRVVVLPPLLNLRSGTLNLLHDFAISGGIVLAVGSVPELVDGRRSDQAAKFFEEYGERIVQGTDFGRYHALIDRLRRAKISATLIDADQHRAPECVTSLTRVWDEIGFTAAHNGGDRTVHVTLEQPARLSGHAEQWDPLTGTLVPLGAITAGEAIHHTITLEPGAASLVVSMPEELDKPIAGAAFTEEARIVPPWSVRRMAPNATALAECRIADGVGSDWVGPNELRQRLAERIAQARGPVSLRTQWRFRVAAGTPIINDCFVLAELSEGASMRLNNDELPTDGDEWALDLAMRMVPLPPLNSGEHTLEVWRLYATPGDFQAPWLRGPFADVTLKDECTRIAPARDTIAVGSLESQGLRDYFGTIVYTARVDGAPQTEGRRVELRLRGLSEIAEVRVDGSRGGFALPPHTSVDLTESWRAGTRTVEIILRIPPDNLLAQLRDGRTAASTHHGLPSPPELITLRR